LDVPTVGTLGLLAVAKRDGHLDRVRPAITALRQAGLHVDEALVERVLGMVDES
jgi:predicted nucleic acid-binding protein